MLCASGFEFEEKLQRARAEHENAQRALQSVSVLHQRSSKRFENAVRRYNRRLSDLVNHKRVCTLCRGS
jgi:flagellar biosynthesis chaperone FliJ